MKRQFMTDRLENVRVFADTAEQMAPEFGRTVAAVQEFSDHAKVLIEVVSPFAHWIKVRLSRPTNGQVLVRTNTADPIVVESARRPGHIDGIPPHPLGTTGTLPVSSPRRSSRGSL
ncbi:hypothetical protein [Modestobacter altitudinis]|uniref:hypothetical protein n=1 Tax=Modestobacter altitudinis TaxID=2213158 RepID=UPI00110D2149|nr:hypothetical protein [Modestobacter altitudinis]